MGLTFSVNSRARPNIAFDPTTGATAALLCDVIALSTRLIAHERAHVRPNGERITRWESDRSAAAAACRRLDSQDSQSLALLAADSDRTRGELLEATARGRARLGDR